MRSRDLSELVINVSINSSLGYGGEVVRIWSEKSHLFILAR